MLLAGPSCLDVHHFDKLILSWFLILLEVHFTKLTKIFGLSFVSSFPKYMVKDLLILLVSLLIEF